MSHAFRLPVPLASVVALGLGLTIAVLDLVAPFGDDSAQFTVLLWLVCCAGLGFAVPRRPWRWAVLVGPWLPVLYLTLGVFRLLAFGKAFSYADTLLIPVALGVCLIGAYIGALSRRIALPPSSVEILA